MSSLPKMNIFKQQQTGCERPPQMDLPHVADKHLDSEGKGTMGKLDSRPLSLSNARFSETAAAGGGEKEVHREKEIHRRGRRPEKNSTPLLRPESPLSPSCIPPESTRSDRFRSGSESPPLSFFTHSVSDRHRRPSSPFPFTAEAVLSVDAVPRRR